MRVLEEHCFSDNDSIEDIPAVVYEEALPLCALRFSNVGLFPFVCGNLPDVVADVVCFNADTVAICFNDVCTALVSLCNSSCFSSTSLI